MSRAIVRAQQHLAGLRVSLIGLAAVTGAVLFAALAPAGWRASASYLGGLLLVAAAFEFGRFNITLVARIAPKLTLAMALFSYLITVLALGLVLAASSPRVVVGRAVAVGLLTGLVIWVFSEILRAWVVQEHP